MPFPSSTGTKQADCALAWSQARGYAGAIKQRAQVLRDASNVGQATSGQVLGFATFIADMKIALQACAAVQGIATYAQAQVNDPTLDVAAAFTAMMNAIDGTVAWVIANFPKDASGFLLAASFASDNSGRTADRVFSQSATAGLRTQLDALIATID